MHAVAAFFASIITFVSGLFGSPLLATNSPTNIPTAQSAATAVAQTEIIGNPFADPATPSAVTAAIPASAPALGFSASPPQTIINQPVIERIIERIVPQGGTIPAATLAAILADFEQSISSRIAAINPPKAAIPEQVAAAGNSASYYFAPASQRIDQLSNTTINNPTISGGSISGASITGTITNAIDTAFATINDLTSNTVTATNAVYSNATTTNLSVTNFTAAATSTLAGLTLSATDCSAYGNGGKLTTDAFGVVVCAADQGGGGGVVGGLNTQIQFNDGGVFGGNAGFTYDKTAQRVAVAYASTTGVTASYASSTQGFFGTLSAGSLSLTTPLSAVNGGTGIGNPASAGILVGSFGGGSWQQLATSSLGLLTSDIAEGSNLYFTNNRVAGVLAGTTTDALTEGSTRLYFTNGRVQTYLETLAKGYFFSTTSADYWKGVTSFFSTSSTDYWKSQNSFFSTTSVAYWESTQARWATTSADYWKTQTAFTGASTTLLANNNTWSGLNAFANSSSTLATLGNAWITGVTASRLLALDENGKVSATTTIGWNLLKGPASSLFAFDASGNPTATTTIGVNYLSGILPIANGGTATGTQVTNGVNFFDGTRITSGNGFVFNGSNVGIGTTNPSYKLDVNGFINTDQSSGYKQAGFTVLYASTTNAALALGASGAAEWMNASSTVWASLAVGSGALATAPTSGASQYNTAVGTNSLYSNQTGANQTALGYAALFSNTTGHGNTALGVGTLQSNTTGFFSTAIGVNALNANTTGLEGLAIGFTTLASNTTGSFNVAIGNASMLQSTIGAQNVGLGHHTLYYATSSDYTVAIGNRAFEGTAAYANEGGTAVGFQAGLNVANGANYNTLLGYQAGYDVTNGWGNIVLGAATSTGSGITTGSNNILIGNGVRAGLSQTGSNQLNIGNLIFGTGLGSGGALSTGNIGIGTTTPGTLLSINNIANLAAAGSTFYSPASFSNAITFSDTLKQSRISDPMGDVFMFTSSLGVQTGPNRNAIVGSVVQDGSNGWSFPTGVTGYAALRHAGNTAFGMFARADCYTPGSCVSEMNSFNYSAPPSGTFPQNKSFGTPDTVPIALTLAAGGDYQSAMALQIDKEGSDPNNFIAGIYMNPGAISHYGLLIDADATNGPILSALLKNTGQGSNTHLTLQTTGTAVPGNKAIQHLDAGGSPTWWITQGGTGYLSNLGIGTSTPGSLLSLNNIANFTTATSTFYSTGGISLAAGCFAKAGNCLSFADLTGTLGIAQGGTGTTTQVTGGVNYFDGIKITSGTRFIFNGTNVGIGTTTPSVLLELGDSANARVGQYVTNSNTGASAFAEIAARNGYAATDALRLLTMGTSWTSTGAFVQDAGVLSADAGLSGGLSLAALASGSSVRVYTNGQNERMRIDSAGNVGIGTSTPGSLLSLNNIANFTAATSTFYSTGGISLAAGCFAISGNCLSLTTLPGILSVTQGGTGVSEPSVAGFPIEAYGAVGNGTTDDSSAIQSAIDAACATRGGKVVFAAKIYAIASTLDINCNNVYLEGQGAGGPVAPANPSAYTNANNIGATVLKWTGSTGGTMVKFEPANGSAKGVKGGGVDGIVLAGYGVAGTGLKILSVRGAQFPRLTVENVTTLGVAVGVTTNTLTTDVYDSQNNVFGQLTVMLDWNMPAVVNAGGVHLGGNTTANASFNVFNDIYLIHEAGIGVHFDGADSNTIGTVKAFQPVSYSGPLIEFSASTTEPGAGRDNTIFFAQGHGGVIARAGAGLVASYNNQILSYDPGNGSPSLPIIESGATLAYQTTRGQLGTTTVETSLGIGGAPSNKLDMFTAAQTTQGAKFAGSDNHYLMLRPSMSAGANNAIVQAGDSGIIFSNNVVDTGAFVIAPWGSGTPGLRMTASGWIGVGTSTPGSLLSLNNIANFTTATSTFYSTGGINLAAGCFAKAGNCLSFADLTGTLGIAQGGTGTTTQVTNGVTYFDGTKITSGTSFVFNGTNVGIGTTSLSARLTVQGTGSGVMNIGQFNGNSSLSGIGFSVGASALVSATNYALLGDTTQTFLNAPAGGNINFRIGNNDKMNLIGSTGNFGIGTTTPWGKLSVTGSGTGAGLAFAVADNANTPRFVIQDNGNVGLGTTSPTAQLHTTGTVRFSNFGAGTLTTDASGNLSVSSDERLKNIDDAFTRGLADIVKLSPIQYHWNPLSGLDTSTQYAGFSAQNVQQAIPEAVGSSANGFLSLQDRPLIAAVVNAIKELSAKLDTLATQVSGFAESFTTRELVAVNGDFHRVTTGELCARKADNTAVCVTGDQLAALLGQSAATALTAAPAPSIAPRSPVIELNGNATSTISLGAAYNDLGARIVAPENDLNLGIVILLDGATTTGVSIDTTQPGEHTILYTVTSPTTGLSGSIMRTVIIAPAEQSSVQEEEIDPFNAQPANDNASSTTAVDAAA